MPYFDLFVAAVPIAKRGAYEAHCAASWAVFQELGGVASHELWQDDVPEGEVTSLPLAVQCQEDEAVVASLVEWPDKETRDAGWSRMMAEPDLGARMGEMPFDGKRMIFGGFTLIRLDR